MIVASDLEGTLTSGETWRALVRYLCDRGRTAAYNRLVVANLPAFLAAKAGLADMTAFRNRWLSGLLALFAGLPAAEWNSLAEWVVDDELWLKRREPVLDELRRHQEMGRRVILASSTVQPVLEAFARRIGAEALGTALEFVDGKTTGRLVPPVNSGTAKAERLRAWAGTDELHMAYGDTPADVPMLEVAGTAVVVHPAPRFRRLALERGWRILEMPDPAKAQRRPTWPCKKEQQWQSAISSNVLPG